MRGDSYEFIRTDSGHPFNIGDQWQSTIEALAPVSTSTHDLVDGIGSIIDGESLAIDIPIDFKDDTFVPFDYGYFAFVYDENKTKNIPNSFEALVSMPEDFKIVIQDPRSSTAGLGLLLWVKSIYGDKAALFLEGENNLRLIKKTKFNEQEFPKVIDYSKRDALFKYKWINNSIWRASFLRQVKEIIKYLKNNKNKKYHGANFNDAIYVRKIIQRIEQSNKTGKVLRI